MLFQRWASAELQRADSQANDVFANLCHLDDQKNMVSIVCTPPQVQGFTAVCQQQMQILTRAEPPPVAPLATSTSSFED